MKIMLVVTGLNRGGAERQVVHLAAGLLCRGHRVMVVSMLVSGPLRAELDAMGVEVRTLGLSRGEIRPGAVAVLRGMIGEAAPDVVHSHMFHATLLARMAMVGGNGVPLVSTAHTIDEGRWWRPIVSRLTHRLSAIDTNVTRAGVEAFEKNGSVPRGKMIVVPNGVPLHPVPRPVRFHDGGTLFRWICVARSSQAKGIDILVHAFASSERLRTESSLTVVGGGEQLDANRKLAAELGVAQGISFPGEENDLACRYRSADAMVLPSRWEGLPMVLLEAGCHGMPVVATAVGGVPELIGNGAGILVDSESPALLAGGMLKMMDVGDEARLLMGSTLAERVVYGYGMEYVLDRWEDIYDRVVRDTRRSP